MPTMRVNMKGSRRPINSRQNHFLYCKYCCQPLGNGANCNWSVWSGGKLWSLFKEVYTGKRHTANGGLQDGSFALAIPFPKNDMGLKGIRLLPHKT